MRFILTIIKIFIYNITHKSKGNISISKTVTKEDIQYLITIKRN